MPASAPGSAGGRRRSPSASRALPPIPKCRFTIVRLRGRSRCAARFATRVSARARAPGFGLRLSVVCDRGRRACRPSRALSSETTADRAPALRRPPRPGSAVASASSRRLGCASGRRSDVAGGGDEPPPLAHRPRDSHDAAAGRDGVRDGGADAPEGVGGEARPALRVVLVDRRQQAYRALLHEVVDRQRRGCGSGRRSSGRDPCVPRRARRGRRGRRGGRARRVARSGRAACGVPGMASRRDEAAAARSTIVRGMGLLRLVVPKVSPDRAGRAHPGRSRADGDAPRGYSPSLRLLIPAPPACARRGRPCQRAGGTTDRPRRCRLTDGARAASRARAPARSSARRRSRAPSVRRGQVGGAERVLEERDLDRPASRSTISHATARFSHLFANGRSSIERRSERKLYALKNSIRISVAKIVMRASLEAAVPRRAPRRTERG